MAKTDFQYDPIISAVSAEIYPDIAKKQALPVDEFNSLSKSSLRRLQAQGTAILILFKEQEIESKPNALLKSMTPLSSDGEKSNSSLERGSVHGSLGHTSLSLFPSETNHIFSIPEFCYRDMTELECVKCEFSKACNQRLLTMHRLKAVGLHSIIFGSARNL